MGPSSVESRFRLSGQISTKRGRDKRARKRPGMKVLILVLAATLIMGCSKPAPDANPDASASPAGGGTGVIASATPEAEPEDGKPYVSFMNIEEGDVVSSPVEVIMEVEGMEVMPAGKEAPNSGHHHIIIDGEPVPKDQVVPADDKHIHFGDGATETTVELPPGEHTLTLQFADYAHRSYGPEMSKTVKIIVE